MTRRRPRDRKNGPRRRVTQETIDQMADLRRQGVTFREVGSRTGCSERTARRYVGNVVPRLHLPGGSSEPAAQDPRELRVRLASEFLELLYWDKQLRSFTVIWKQVDEATQQAIWGGPPSILFLSEAERQIREALDGLGDLALSLLARDRRSQHRFLREVIGFLHADYIRWHRFSQNFGDCSENWRPPRERPPAEEVDEDDPDQF